MPQDVLFHPLEGPSLLVSAIWGLLPGSLASFPEQPSRAGKLGRKQCHTLHPLTLCLPGGAEPV